MFNQFRCHYIHKHLSIVLTALESQRSDHDVALIKLDRSQIAQGTHHVAVLFFIFTNCYYIRNF